MREAVGDARIHIGGGGSPSVPDQSFSHCEVVLGNPPPEWLLEDGNLKWVQLASTGVNSYLDLDWCRLSRRFTVTNLAGFYAEPVAESCLAGILAIMRGIDQLVRLQAKRQWTGDPVRTKLKTLYGARVVLFGYGAINKRLEELLAPFDCHVTRFGSEWQSESLDRALVEADVVACTVPETRQTRGVFDRDRIRKMSPLAVFANFGRGSLIDEDALVDSLMEGDIGGAVIDVTKEEPLPPDNRLWACPNVILTQHSGGGTTDEFRQMIVEFVENLGRYRSGLPLKGLVDFSKGY